MWAAASGHAPHQAHAGVAFAVLQLIEVPIVAPQKQAVPQGGTAAHVDEAAGDAVPHGLHQLEVVTAVRMVVDGLQEEADDLQGRADWWVRHKVCCLPEYVLVWV